VPLKPSLVLEIKGFIAACLNTIREYLESLSKAARSTKMTLKCVAAQKLSVSNELS